MKFDPNPKPIVDLAEFMRDHRECEQRRHEREVWRARRIRYGRQCVGLDIDDSPEPDHRDDVSELWP